MIPDSSWFLLFYAGVIAIALTTGFSHTCALLQENAVGLEILCWGRNADGELGIGNNTDMNIPVRVNLVVGKEDNQFSHN